MKMWLKSSPWDSAPEIRYAIYQRKYRYVRYVLPSSNEIPGQNSKYIDEGIAVPVSLLHLYCHSLSLEMTRAEPSEPSIGQTVWDAIHRRSSTTTMFLTGQLKVYKQNINTDRIAQTLISLLSLLFNQCPLLFCWMRGFVLTSRLGTWHQAWGLTLSQRPLLSARRNIAYNCVVTCKF